MYESKQSFQNRINTLLEWKIFLFFFSWLSRQPIYRTVTWWREKKLCLNTMNHSKKPFHLGLGRVFGAYASTNNHNHISLEILYPFIKMFLLFFIFHECHFFPPRIIDVKHSADSHSQFEFRQMNDWLNWTDLSSFLKGLKLFKLSQILPLIALKLREKRTQADYTHNHFHTFNGGF